MGCLPVNPVYYHTFKNNSYYVIINWPFAVHNNNNLVYNGYGSIPTFTTKTHTTDGHVCEIKAFQKIGKGQFIAIVEDSTNNYSYAATSKNNTALWEKQFVLECNVNYPIVYVTGALNGRVITTERIDGTPSNFTKTKLSNDLGKTWTNGAVLNGYALSPITQYKNNLWLLTYLDTGPNYLRYNYSNDGGSSWSEYVLNNHTDYEHTETDYSTTDCDINGKILYPRQYSSIYGFNASIRRFDGSTQETLLNEALPAGATIDGFKWVKVRGDKIWAYRYYADAGTKYHKLYYSTNSGASWTSQIMPIAGSSNVYPMCFMDHTNDCTRAFISVDKDVNDNHFLFTTDGVTWKQMPNGNFVIDKYTIDRNFHLRNCCN